MTLGLLGINIKSIAMARYIIKHAQNGSIKISGVYTRGVTATTNAAIKLGTTAYPNMDSLVRNSDILLIGHSDKELVDISNKIKKKSVKGKIMCHFSTEYDSSIISYGVTNTCYSITLPYSYDTTKPPDYSKTLVLFEGFGRQEKEFEEAIQTALPNCKFCTKTDRRLALIAKRVATVHLSNIIRFARHLFKIAGIFDEDCIKVLLTACTLDSCCEIKHGTATGKTNGSELKKNLGLLEIMNDSDGKEYYKNLELHSLETIEYPTEEKNKLQKILGKRVKRT